MGAASAAITLGGADDEADASDEACDASELLPEAIGSDVDHWIDEADGEDDELADAELLEALLLAAPAAALDAPVAALLELADDDLWCDLCFFELLDDGPVAVAALPLEDDAVLEGR